MKFYYSYFLILIVTLFVACNKSDDRANISTPYIEGEPVTLKLEAASSNVGSSAAKYIVGPFNTSYMDCQWEMQAGDVIYVTYNSITEEFVIKSVDGKTASCNGTMPAGWQPGNKFDVVAGVDPSVTTPPTTSDIDGSYDGIRRGYMRFEGSGTSIEGDAIKLTAAWSAMRVSIQFTPSYDPIALPGGHSAEDMKVVVTKIEVLEQAEPHKVMYSYICKTGNNDNIIIEAPKSGTGFAGVNLTQIVAPSDDDHNYNGFIYKIYVDKNQCGDSEVEPVDKKDYYAFQFGEWTGDQFEPQDLNLPANKFLLQSTPVDMAILFTTK